MKTKQDAPAINFIHSAHFDPYFKKPALLTC